ncbi:non-canonical purine NTP pyrophosphatase [Colwellia sp. MT41]|uniref:RdgB/HAM1 family non-canonical purine NTP pyrophosphatase n=1 Tax=Colwellia sp. MT41 TaxID=58049 RepID=UPI000717798E|nr:non-canonical purine NTP pyrophosphatase [Colwellia sp. MT41]
MSKIVLATGNLGKVKELAHLLTEQGIDIVPQSEFDVAEVAETGTTFVENAIIKARHAAKITGLPAIADDSGLEVDALNGAPGVYSARYAADITQGQVTDDDNTNKLLAALANTPDEQRTARFHCVLVYMKHENDPTPLICHGVWQGTITRSKQGEQGFGYDPVFWQSDLQMTSAQLPRAVKNTRSHRGQALAKLVTQLAKARA